MTKQDLTRALERGATNEEWAAAIAAFFDAHPLCYGHGTDNALDEACWLLRHLQGWDRSRWDAPARPGLAGRVVELAHRRADSRKPLAYLINEAWFCGARYYVDERVLVPRSPIAEIIERGFEPWIVPQRGDRMLDIGTGSGCIAIAAALQCPQVIVDATDASTDALAVAERNVALHGVGERVQLHRANLYPGGAHRYRVIMSNPPYVPEAHYARLPAEYHHEPRQGLVGGPSGLEPAWSILAAAAERLTDDGIVILEVGLVAAQLDAAVPGLEPVWVEFERGGEGVCVVQGRALRDYLRAHALPAGL